MKKRQKVQAVIFAKDASGQKHFLLLQTNAERKAFWQNVTGGVDFGESFEEALIREAYEETSIEKELLAKFYGPFQEYFFEDRWGHHVHEKVFAIELEDIFEIKIDPSEHQAFRWVKETELSPTTLGFESNYHAILEVLKKW